MERNRPLTWDCVGPITLIKSLNENDERIEIAIEEMMEDTEWFEV